jgi:hypothetical protein
MICRSCERAGGAGGETINFLERVRGGLQNPRGLGFMLKPPEVWRASFSLFSFETIRES